MCAARPMSCVIFLPLPNQPAGRGSHPSIREATGIIYHRLNVQSVLAVVNVFSEEQKVIVFNNALSERTFVRVKKYSSPPQRWIGQISIFSDSNMDFPEILLNFQCFHILYGKIYSLWEFQKPPILKVMQNFAPVFIFHGAVWLAHQRKRFNI